MALQLNLDQSSVGVPFSDAYAKINTFHGNKDSVQYMVLIYATEGARQGNAKEVGMQGYQCMMPQGPLLEGLYADLKTRPGFENATDV